MPYLNYSSETKKFSVDRFRLACATINARGDVAGVICDSMDNVRSTMPFVVADLNQVMADVMDKDVLFGMFGQEDDIKAIADIVYGVLLKEGKN